LPFSCERWEMFSFSFTHKLCRKVSSAFMETLFCDEAKIPLVIRSSTKEDKKISKKGVHSIKILKTLVSKLWFSWEGWIENYRTLKMIRDELWKKSGGKLKGKSVSESGDERETEWIVLRDFNFNEVVSET
jgi:hypothetical protein